MTLREQYPLRGFSATFVLNLPTSGKMLEKFRTEFNEAINKDKNCENRTTDFLCIGANIVDHSRSLYYGIKDDSPLFPQEEAGWMLKNMQIMVRLYALKTGSDSNKLKYEDQGEFVIGWDDIDFSKNNVSILYDGHASLWFTFAELPISDERIAASGVQSLVDILPGAITVYPTIGEPNLRCPWEEKCHEIFSIVRNTTIKLLYLNSPRSKSLEILPSVAPLGVRCSESSFRPNAIVLVLPDDVRKISKTGDFELAEKGSRPPPPCE